MLRLFSDLSESRIIAQNVSFQANAVNTNWVYFKMLKKEKVKLSNFPPFPPPDVPRETL